MKSIKPNARYRLTADFLELKAGAVFETDNFGASKASYCISSPAGHSFVCPSSIELQSWLDSGRIEEAEEEGDWRPKEGEKFWVLEGDGFRREVTFYGVSDWSQSLLAFGNYFRTEAAAKEAAEKVKALLLGLKRG